MSDALSDALSDEELLAEQQRFYRARAPEYDEWWQRRGRYDRGPALLVEWDRQVDMLEKELADFAPEGRVLELAGGTGWWTERLARTARELTVVDSSPETLQLNRRRVGRPEVQYVVADLFTWTPDVTWDVVFFSFWISHVPRARFAAFWNMVRTCVAPGGRVFLIDNRDDPQPAIGSSDPYVVEYGRDVHLRHVGGGSQYRVVKVMYEPEELQALIEAEGWTCSMGSTGWFIYGAAQPS